MSTAVSTHKEVTKKTARGSPTTDFDAAGTIDLPYPYASYILSQYTLFLRVQRLRYVVAAAAATAAGAGANAGAAAVAAVPAQVEQDNALALSDWSALYEASLTADSAPVYDERCASLWAFATVMLRLHERPAAPPAGRLVQEWYCRFFFDPATIQTYTRELTQAYLLENSTEVLDTIETLFLIGAFSLAAELFDAAHRHLYNTPEGRQLLQSEIATQETLERLLRLLTVPFDSAASHARWRAEANDAMHVGKTSLDLPFPKKTAVGSALDDLLRLARQMLLIISGDDVILAKRCKRLHGAMSESLFLFASYCAIRAAYEPLESIAELYDQSLATVQGEGQKGEWYLEVMGLLVHTQSVEDMVYAMAQVADVVERTFPWAPACLLGEGEEDRDDNDDDDDDDAAGSPQQQSNRRFVLLAMAAHTADLCAPAIVAPAAQIGLTFARNDLLTAYTRLFRGCARLWKVAGCYLVYAPLLNPVELYNGLVPAAVRAAASTATYNAFCRFVHRMLDANAPVQQELRRLLLARLGDCSTAEAWVAAVDHYRDRLYREAHQHIIAARLAGGDGGWAAWLAVEVQQLEPLQWTLQARLLAATALEDELLLVVGEAVQNGFLALDTCPTTELLYSLRCCAALSVYRRAAAAVRPWLLFYTDAQQKQQQQQQGFDEAAAMQAAAWCLDALRDVLKRIDACDFYVHPKTIFALVEHGADVVLALRRWLAARAPQPQHRSSAHLSEALLPLLTEALEATRTHQAKHRAWMDQRAPVLLEKLMQMVDTHLE